MVNDEYQDNVIKDVVKQKAKRKIWGWVLAVLGTIAPYMMILLMVIFLGSGMFSAFSAVGGMLNGLLGRSDMEALKEYTTVLEGLTDEEILELVKSDKIDDSFYEVMLINKDELQYLLERVIEYNSQEAVQTIQVERMHIYQEWVEIEKPDMPYAPGTEMLPDIDDEPEGYYVERTEYVYKPYEVRSRDIEKFKLDWELIYGLCLTSTMDGISDWERLFGNGNEKGYLQHYGVEHEDIDFIMSNVQMNYEYITDLSRSPKTSYTLEECRSMVHTKIEYGDKNTEEGYWLYYTPHSVISRAYSGYSCMYYLIDESTGMLTNMITASDVKHFELIINRFCPKYNFGYFSNLLSLMPGGENIKRKLEVYYAHKETGYEIENKLINYTIGYGIDKTLLPTSTQRLETEFGDLVDYGDLIYDATLGGNIVREAMSKIGCEYSQANRWGANSYDCSSFIWRILQAVGIDLGKICKGSTAAEECRGMVDAGLVVSINDIQQGDVIFYSSYVNGRYRNVTHVAFYAGDGKIVHAANARDGVKIGNMYTKGLVCVCRPYK